MKLKRVQVVEFMYVLAFHVIVALAICFVLSPAPSEYFSWSDKLRWSQLRMRYDGASYEALGVEVGSRKPSRACQSHPFEPLVPASYPILQFCFFFIPQFSFHFITLIIAFTPFDELCNPSTSVSFSNDGDGDGGWGVVEDSSTADNNSWTSASVANWHVNAVSVGRRLSGWARIMLAEASWRRRVGYVAERKSCAESC